MKKEKFLHSVTMLGLGILVVASVVALFGFVAMFLWNKLLPDIFGLPAINYWQAVGLLILARLFFTGIKPGKTKKRRRQKKEKNLFQDKWESMSGEERSAFIKRQPAPSPKGEGSPLHGTNTNESELQQE